MSSIMNKLPRSSPLKQEIKQELIYLTKEMSSSKQINTLRRLNCKIQDLRNQTLSLLKRSSYFIFVKPTMSYAEKARNNCIKDNTVISEKFDDSDPVPLITREEARLDFLKNIESCKKERKIFKELASSIRDRFAKRRERRSVFLIRNLREARRNLNRERRFLKRHPGKEVKDFPIGCFEVNFSINEEVKLLEPEIKRIALPTSKKQYKKKWNRSQTLKEILNNRYFKKEKQPFCRIHHDYLRFKRYLNVMKIKEPFKYLDIMTTKLNPYIEGQMEEEGEIMSKPTDISKEGNVIIAEPEQTTSASMHKKSENFISYSISNEMQKFDTMTSRWLKLAKFDWTTQVVDQDIEANVVGYANARHTIQLPLDLFSIQDAPNLAILLNHRFFRMGFKLHFVMNSSPWQTGAVVASWTYGHPNDIGELGNVYTMVQRNHGILQAGSSNSVVLNVPYHHYNTFMSNKSNDCVFGFVQIKVLVPLSVLDRVATRATITLYVSLEDVEVHGLISRAITRQDLSQGSPIQGQMDTIGSLCNLGTNLLKAAGPLIDRDNPPRPLQPISLVPQTMPSMCYTDGISEPINVLRANPMGQRINPTRDTRELKTLLRTWGYYRRFKWAFSNAAEDVLAQWRVIPLDENQYYPVHRNLIPGLQTQIYPPIAVLSSLAGKWRGDIEYKFVIVANSFYTGSLQVSVVPLGTSSVSMNEGLGSVSTIVDIKKTSEFTVVAPWNWYNAWAKTRSFFDINGDSPSQILVYVVNPLVAIDKVPIEIDVLVFVRGGLNFEICQMRSPLLSVYDSIIRPPAGEYLEPYNTETEWYGTSSFRAKDTRGYYFPTFFIQNVSDGFVGYKNVGAYRVYRLAPRTLKGRYFRVYLRDTSGSQDIPISSVWFTGLPGFATPRAEGLIAFREVETARSFVADYWRKDRINDFLMTVPTARFSTDGAWSEISDDSITWRRADNESGDHPLILYLPSDQLTGQMNENGTVLIGETANNTTNFGENVYGEAMPMIHSVTRRWQHFASIIGNTCTSKYPRDCNIFCKIPVRPMRTLKPDTSRSYDNRIRDGNINLFSSAFYLYDGGMRYRIIAIKQIPQDTIIYVQHKYDDLDESDEIIVSPTVLKSEYLMDTHYATFSQALAINPVVSVEVPYYKDNERTLTMKSVLKRPLNNGYLYIWVHSSVKADIQLEVYYTIADDFQWSVFQGFPGLFDITQIDDEPGPMEIEDSLKDMVIVGQMDEEPIFEFSMNPKIKQNFVNLQKPIVKPQGILDSATEKVVDSVSIAVEKKLESGPLGDTIKQVGTAASKITESTEKVAESVNKMEETAEVVKESSIKVASVLESVSDHFSKFIDKLTGLPSKLSKSSVGKDNSSVLEDLSNSGFDYITHLIYCAMNPNGRTIGWAIVNIYRNVWGFSLDGFKLITPISNMWNKAERQATEQPQPEGQMEDNDISSVCSIVFCSICTLLKVSAAPPTSWRNIADGLFNFGTNCRVANMVSIFIRDNIKLLKRVWNKFLSYFSSGSKNYKLIAGIEDVRLREWCVHSDALLNPSIREKIYSNPLWSEKIFELAIAGRAFSMVLTGDKTTHPQLMKIINDNVAKLKKFEQDLINRQVFCGERYEPFCVWIGGKAGTGKTRFLQLLATLLADMLKISAPQTYHTITINQQYFDGFVGQPSVLIDDFLAISPAADPTATMFVQMKSSCLFNPPYSDVKDKSKMVNFYNLLISSNFLSVDNQPGIHDYSAYNRRRDLVLEFVETKKKETYTLRDYEELEHVQVYYYPNPLRTDITSRILIPREVSKSYRDVVDDFIRDKAKIYHERESISFQKRAQDKIKRIEKYAKADSVEVYLDGVKNIFTQVIENLKDPCITKSITDGLNAKISSLFGYWSKSQTNNYDTTDEPQTKNSKVIEPKPGCSNQIEFELDNEEEIEPQGLKCIINERLYWPCYRNPDKDDLTDLNSVSPNIVPEPLKRSSAFDYLPGVCLHSLPKKPGSYIYCGRRKTFFYATGTEDLSKVPMSFNAGPCMVKNGKTNKWEFLKTCKLFDDRWCIDFIAEITKNWLLSNPDMNAAWPNIDIKRAEKLAIKIPPCYIEFMSKLAKRTGEGITINYQCNRKIIQEIIDDIQHETASQYEVVGDVLLPRESRWRSIPRMVWRAFLKTCKFIFKALDLLISAVRWISGLMLCTAIGFSCYNAYTNKGNVEGNLHPSGDYKTMKIKSATRAQAARFTTGNGTTTHVTVKNDEDILKACNVIMDDPSADGRLRKIQHNVFTLVGISKTDEDMSIVYRARCIGIKEYDFICLKHYIDYFESKNVQELVIVYNNNQGLIHVDFKDVKFKWTDQGYGVGTFPTLPHMFKNITKFIPSEKSDCVYPYTMNMVTVDAQDMKIINLDCTFVKDIKVPQNGAQRAWNIDNGFTYEWGGSGKCGSFLFASKLACPLVGIHTAGIGEKRGYSELLLRETFVDEEEIQIDYVVPQMHVNPCGSDLPGDGYIVGHLPKDKCVNLPNKTKIIESEIHGVFEPQTEPAPLSKNDPRLPEDCDPLIEGLKRRCDKPKELPEKYLIPVFEDYCNVLISKVKPLREPGVLTVAQAVEGLPGIPYYDPIERSTSEGYPHILRRLSGYSNKSWMFKFEERDGRLWLVGIDSELNHMIKVKEQMRERLIVPASYFTACLKDARILKEKVSIPGKTRLFEMSPIDLTIAIRQYFLDFYAAFQKARLQASHTIGINADGIEWTEVVDYLDVERDKPYVLTADYSGYGPRLLHSVQRLATKATIVWYEHYQNLNNVSDEEIHRQFCVRWCLMYEMIHPYIVVRDCVVQFPTGLQSGSPDTVIKNTQTNYLMIGAVYLMLAERYKPEYSDMYWFHKFVRELTNGDDVILSVSGKIIDWFNNESIISEFAKFNIKMTDALKSGVVRKYCSIEEATYLKRGFKRHPTREGQWLAPLEEASIKDTANWIWKSKDNRQASLVNSEMACRLAYTHGPEFYNKITKRIKKAWLKKGVNFQFPSWNSLDMSVWDGTEGPLFSF